MLKNKFEIIELLIDLLNPMDGVNAVSLVSEPAIETNFYAFGKEYVTNFATIDEEKRMVTGPALIPNKMILRARKNEQKEDEYFYVYFSEDTIRKTSQRFLKNGYQNNSTLEHQIELEGVSVVESWIIEDKANDKSNIYGYDLPIGTWMLTSYIENEDVWNKVKAGEIKGYSIEGIYTDKLLEQSKETTHEVVMVGTDSELELFNQIMELINSVEDEEIL